jgi:hypothetical protein
MAEPWLKIDLNHKLIIVDEEIDVTPMNNYLGALKNNYANKKMDVINPSDDDIKLNQINNYLKMNNEIYSKNIVNKAIYVLFLYSKSNELINAVNEIKGIEISTKTSLVKVNDKTTTCKILNNLLTPLTSTK